ncbi:hypothetical protein CC80DRAFT_487002 [Byssothecium circinans]|uniref:Uncharacterized protein n=1 Tax=Byssothecium circinans TaxID=147558 RepID=A0A6A5UI69_9PLEO|nr:hypothetical protein CC80DRAFT_487002 [Byssothecium circinans]
MRAETHGFELFVNKQIIIKAYTLALGDGPSLSDQLSNFIHRTRNVQLAHLSTIHLSWTHPFTGSPDFLWMTHIGSEDVAKVAVIARAYPNIQFKYRVPGLFRSNVNLLKNSLAAKLWFMEFDYDNITRVQAFVRDTQFDLGPGRSYRFHRFAHHATTAEIARWRHGIPLADLQAPNLRFYPDVDVGELDWEMLAAEVALVESAPQRSGEEARDVWLKWFKHIYENGI